jgi:hypothetical protein
MDSTKRFAFFSCACGACAFGAFAVLILVLASSAAHATQISSALTVTVQEGSDSGSWQMNFSSSNPVVWNSSGQVNIYSSSHPSLFLGSLDAASLSLESDPNVSLAFAVTAGGADTTFTISSPTVSFGALTNPQGFATAGVTLTDNDGNGAAYTGLFPGPKGYQAQYNGRSAVFTNLVSPFTVGPNATLTTSERFPVTGTTAVPGVVSDIESQWSFVLSANDSASGTSRFNVTAPEPSSMILALLGATALLWRVRRRFV